MAEKLDPRTTDIINPELRGMPQADYLQELNIRTHKAGYTTREGKPVPPKIMIKPATEKYRKNYKHIFGHD